jgi:hypothetical protein
MNTRRLRSTVLTAILCLALGSAGFSGQEATSGPVVKPGLGFEYFSRTLTWDEDRYSSPLLATLAYLRGEVALTRDISLGVLAGYGFSNFNGLVFRGLPFSVDFEAGAIGSLLVGADFDAAFIPVGDFRIGATGQFLYVFEHPKDFDLPSLNQSGVVNAKAIWHRIAAGPLVRYMGYESFVPFLAITFNRLTGTFTMAETVQDLTGSEEKKVEGKGSIGISVGTTYEPSAAFHLRAEISALPFAKTGGGLDVDYGASLRAIIVF